MKNQKGFAMSIVIAIIALVVVVAGVGYYATRSQPQTNSVTEAPTGEKTLPDGTVIKADGTMVKPDGAMEKKEGETMMKKEDEITGAPSGDGFAINEPGVGRYAGKVLAGTSAPLLDFVKSDYDQALQSGKLVVLYFYANWCPICRAEFPIAQGVFNELTTNQVIGFRVNYNDSDTDADEKMLAKDFGVAYQHTKVFVRGGERLLKSPEGWSKDRYLKEIFTFIKSPN